MSCNKILLLTMSLTLVSGQRPSFAGSRPIGFPEIIKPTTESLGNRFGEDDVSTTTIRLPIEANGDRDLVDRLSKLPVDQQPFWFINWQAYETHRQSPQTFPQKPNVFVDPGTSNQQPSTSFSQTPMNQPSNNVNSPPSSNQGQMSFNSPPPNFNQGQMNFNRPPPNFNQGQMNFNRPPPNFNQGQMNFNQGQMNSNLPPPNFNQGMNVNQPTTNSNQATDLSNRFSDMDLVNPGSVNTIESTTRSPTLEELVNAQRIKPVKNADGTTSWQIVDKSVLDALDKMQNKPTKL